MTQLQKLILRRLSRKEWVSRAKLYAYLVFYLGEGSDREMRRAIQHLRINEGQMILSSSRGYKMSANVKEFENHLSYKESFAYSILKECRCMRRNFKRNWKPQLFKQ